MTITDMAPPRKYSAEIHLIVAIKTSGADLLHLAGFAAGSRKRSSDPIPKWVLEEMEKHADELVKALATYRATPKA